MGVLKEILYRIRGEYTTEKLISMGMKVVGYGASSGKQSE